MEFLELTEEEFSKFSRNHEEASFYQTTEWGTLKKDNGWDSHFVGIKEKNKIIAASLLLSKKVPLGNKMFYAPRGFLIDYSNLKLLSFLTTNLKNYVKKYNGIFLKIDPYIIYQERDINGNIVKNGKNNKVAFNNLIKLGYKHFGFNMLQESLQPRWIFITETKNKTIDDVMKDMDPKTRQIIRKNERLCIKVREIGYDELDKFKDIMQHTGDRRDFIDRPLSYYQNMYKHLHDPGILKILLGELNTKELLDNLNKELNDYKNELKDRQYKHDNGIIKMNQDKYLSKQKETESNINRIKNKIEEVAKLNKEHGDIITLGGILFLTYGNEVLSLVGGSYKQFMEYQSAYTIHWEGCKYAINNNYERYNFYGITGVFDENNPLYGLYLFKKGYGGKVIELIGEFDFVISKPKYLLYKLSFKIYKFLKNIIKR